MKKLFILLPLLSFMFFVSCDDDSAEEQLKNDIALIEKYLSDNNLTAQSTASGLYYIITAQGNGETPTPNSIVRVEYTGRLLNGTIFDRGTADYIPLSGYVPGWIEGMQLFKEGGYGKLFLPSALGYGSRPVGTIPANSVLIFDVKLVDVSN
ncbi:MAG TPA: FKBP-type peptidyl-prolyl cis-trans isomerase [Bacteroidales bacterium]|nr:FKBP-type peptidyl-prolyl cis-trans isomerase [Bacteroidales bacterium]